MNHYQSNLNLAELCQLTRLAGHIVVTSHAKPDGDAFGSVVALSTALTRLGATVSPWLIPPVPTQFKQIRGWSTVSFYEPSATIGQPDLVIVLDTGAWSQMAAMRSDLSRLLDRTMIIDHHLTGDIPARWQYIDPQAAACCEIVAQIIDHLAMGEPGTKNHHDLLTPIVCEALFVGLATDTGWFRFSNTRPQTHELAAKLLRLGVDHAQLYKKIEQAERIEKLTLITRALESINIVADGRAAIMVLRERDFLESGTVMEETERLVDIPQIVSTIQLVALVTEPPRIAELSGRGNPSSTEGDEPPRPSTRLSFRSKPGSDAVDVSRLAEQFGGGGHARAAGAKVDAPIDQVIDQVTQRVEAAMAEVSATKP